MPRGKQPHTPDQKLLMARVAGKFKLKKAELDRKGESSVATMAEQLGISKASMYNYLNEDDLPNGAVLEKARELWTMNFEDSGLPLHGVEESFQQNRSRKRRKVPNANQYILPFLEAVTQSDIKVVRVQAKKPSAVELVLNIKFGS